MCSAIGYFSRPANDSFREVIKCTEVYIIPIKCDKTFKLLFVALVSNGHYAAAATAPRGGEIKLNTLEEKRRLSMSLSCRMTAFMDCFVSTWKSFTDGCSPSCSGEQRSRLIRERGGANTLPRSGGAQILSSENVCF